MTHQRASQAALAGGRISAGRISPLPGQLFLVRRDLLHRADVEMGMFHAIPVVLIALAGPLRVSFRRKFYDLQPGEAIAVPATTWHTYHVGQRHRGMLAGFGWLGDRADLWLEGPDFSLWATLPLEPARRLIRQSIDDDAATRTTAVRTLLQSVADESLDGMCLLTQPIAGMLEVILKRLHLGPTVTDLVRASGLGRSQAYAVFINFYGLSPRRALELRRLEMAEAVLAAGHGVAETAAVCGWRNRETFSRAWSRHHTHPPRTARGVGRTKG